MTTFEFKTQDDGMITLWIYHGDYSTYRIDITDKEAETILDDLFTELVGNK